MTIKTWRRFGTDGARLERPVQYRFHYLAGIGDWFPVGGVNCPQR